MVFLRLWVCSLTGKTPLNIPVGLKADVLNRKVKQRI